MQHYRINIHRFSLLNLLLFLVFLFFTLPPPQSPQS